MERRRSRQEWKQIVREWKRSGLSRGQFAALRGFNARTLGFWCWTLRQDRAVSSASQVRLLPVHVAHAPADDAGVSVPTEHEPHAVVDLTGGSLRLEFALGSDPRHVAELIAAIRAKAC
jgi:hypothetical protein